MLVAFVMGLMLAVTTVFLTRFATAATSRRHRSVLRRLRRFGVHVPHRRAKLEPVDRPSQDDPAGPGGPCGGDAAAAIRDDGLACSPFLRSLGGFGHALLFPAVVSLGSEAFPREYRGTGTTIVMGFFDVGTFVSAPILGAIIDALRRHRLHRDVPVRCRCRDLGRGTLSFDLGSHTRFRSARRFHRYRPEPIARPKQSGRGRTSQIDLFSRQNFGAEAIRCLMSASGWTNLPRTAVL